MKMLDVVGCQPTDRTKDVSVMHFSYSTMYSSNMPHDDSKYPTVAFAFSKCAADNVSTIELVRIPKTELARDNEDLEKISTAAADAYDALLLKRLKDIVNPPWKDSELCGCDEIARAASMLTGVTMAANNIAIKTRRSMGNVTVGSKRFVKMMKTLGFNKDAAETPTGCTMAYAGHINGDQQLLIQDNTSDDEECSAIIGYLGTTSGDTGFIFLPYAPAVYAETEDSIVIYCMHTIYANTHIVNSYYEALKFKV